LSGGPRRCSPRTRWSRPCRPCEEKCCNPMCCPAAMCECSRECSRARARARVCSCEPRVSVVATTTAGLGQRTRYCCTVCRTVNSTTCVCVCVCVCVWTARSALIGGSEATSPQRVWRPGQILAVRRCPSRRGGWAYAPPTRSPSPRPLHWPLASPMTMTTVQWGGCVAHRLLARAGHPGRRLSTSCLAKPEVTVDHR